MSTQQSSSKSASKEPSIAIDGFAVLRWFDKLFKELLETSWGPLLRHGEVEILESLRCELFYSTMALLRRGCTTTRSPGLVGRVSASVALWGYHQKFNARTRQAARKTSPLERADILFWPCEPTHIKAMHPVFQSLASQDIAFGVFACKPNVLDELLSKGAKAVFPNAYWADEWRAATREGKALAARLAAADAIDFSLLTPFDDTQALVENLRVEAARMMPDVFRAQCNVDNVLSRIRPRLLVVGNDFTYEGRVGCQVARANGISTASQMHGVVANNPLHSTHIVDRFLAYGESARRHLLEIGLTDEQVAVVGAPYLDDQPRPSARIDPEIRDNLQLDTSRPYVLVANSGPGNTISFEHHDRVLEALCRASVALPEVQFVAKLHRKDKVEFYKRAEAIVPESRLQFVPSGTPEYPGNIFNWLQGASVLLTGASAVAVEAMLMDVPVITMDFANEISGADFIDMRASTHVTEPAALIDAVRTILELSEQREEALSRSRVFLQDMFLDVDGNSAQRAGEEFCRLARLSD